MGSKQRQKRGRLRLSRSGALVAAGFCGALLGLAGAAAVGGASSARASREAAVVSHAVGLDLRDAPDIAIAQARPARGAALVAALAPERLSVPPAMREAPPRIAIVFDDMGLSREAFDAVMALPGPLTLSFLPYGRDPQALVDEARAKGHAVMLHLPMQPSGAADPGPRALERGMSARDFAAALDWNMRRFAGYTGVNNHMGSALTRDADAMASVLARVKEEGLFFLDSVTTGGTLAPQVGDEIGARVIVRDVFLDAEPGEEAVRRHLAQVERIARETGFAIAICHPRAETMKVVGPWLTSAPNRGFSLVTVDSLAGEQSLNIAEGAPPALR